ncbi:hypothetical protein ABE385_04630 [Bacillus velezensis]|uniref:hypothetical protein n=1 Tax=Bacillus velezensis TaxID=492670 RepID=UPI00100B815B|nr:hypothetical protein [Bacillus velezensis]MED1774043.1 hypothetical protein [Bacillus velezensis]RXK26681.1 hypothetical protein P42_16240 [Bacillus velezensis]
MKERIEWLKGLTYIPQKEMGWLLEQAELSAKQQEIIEENKRQQEIAVNQFRQAQEEIQRLTKENEELKIKVEEQKEESVMNDTYMVYDTQSEDVQFHGTMKSAGKDFECAMDELDNGETAYIFKVIKEFTPKGAAE